MADRFWVGNTGNWDDNTNHWSASSNGAPGASAPTASDNAIFDANSFSATGKTVTIRSGQSNNCKNLDMSAVINSPTLAGASGSQLNISGDTTIPASVTITTTGTVIFDFVSTGTQNIGIIPVSSVFFVKDAGSGGILNFTQDLSIRALQIQITATVTTNNHAITLTGNDSAIINTGVTFNLGSSVITITGNVTWNWGNAGVGTITMNAGTSLFVFTGTVIFNINSNAIPGGAGLQFNDFHINNAGNNQLTTSFQSSSHIFSINNLTIDAGATVQFGLGLFKVRGTLIANGTSGAQITLKSTSGGTNWTIDSATTVLVNYCIVSDSHASDVTPFTDVNGTDSGGNLNWVFTQSGTAAIFGFLLT